MNKNFYKAYNITKQLCFLVSRYKLFFFFLLFILGQSHYNSYIELMFLQHLDEAELLGFYLQLVLLITLKFQRFGPKLILFQLIPNLPIPLHITLYALMLINQLFVCLFVQSLKMAPLSVGFPRKNTTASCHKKNKNIHIYNRSLMSSRNRK